MTDQPVTVLTEDILGEFGFRVVWSYSEYRAEVKAYHIASRGMDAANTPMFLREGYRASDDLVLDIEQAAVYLEGSLKGDGCSDLDQGAHHWCEEQDVIKHCLLLKYLWTRAHQLIPTSECRPRSN